MSENERTEDYTLEKLRDDLTEFRHSNPLKKPHERFWTIASQLVGKYGVSKVSQEVGLDFSELRKRLRQENGLEQKTTSLSSSEKERAPKIEFVELAVPSNRRTAAAAPSKIKIRIKTPLGSTFSIQAEPRSSRQWEKLFSGWLRAEQRMRGASL